MDLSRFLTSHVWVTYDSSDNEVNGITIDVAFQDGSSLWIFMRGWWLLVGKPAFPFICLTNALVIQISEGYDVLADAGHFKILEVEDPDTHQEWQGFRNMGIADRLRYADSLQAVADDMGIPPHLVQEWISLLLGEPHEDVLRDEG